MGTVPKSIPILAATLMAIATTSGAAPRGQKVFEEVCAACHLGGIGGAPATRDRANWQQRLQQGEDVLVQHAMEGFRGMPAKGGSPGLTEAEIRAAIRHMTRNPTGR